MLIDFDTEMSMPFFSGLFEEGMPPIEKFYSNDKGVSKKSDTLLYLNHDKDTITLSNPEPGSTAVFYVTLAWSKYKKNVWGKKGDKVDDGVKAATITLVFNQPPVVEGQMGAIKVIGNTVVITNREGWVDEKGAFKDRYYDRNIAVELRSFTPAEGETQYSEGGGGTKDDTQMTKNLKMVAIGIVIIIGVGGAAYFFTKKKPAKQVATTPQQLAAPTPGVA